MADCSSTRLTVLPHARRPPPARCRRPARARASRRLAWPAGAHAGGCRARAAAPDAGTPAVALRPTRSAGRGRRHRRPADASRDESDVIADPRRGQPPRRGRGRPARARRTRWVDRLRPGAHRARTSGRSGPGLLPDIQLLVQRLPTAASPTSSGCTERPVGPRREAPGQRGAEQGRLQGHHRHQGRTSILDLDAVRRNVQEDPGEVRREGLLPRRGHLPDRSRPGDEPGRRGVRHQRAREGHGEAGQPASAPRRCPPTSSRP